MTDREIHVLSWVGSAFMFAFLLVGAPYIALGFAAFATVFFIWGIVRTIRSGGGGPRGPIQPA